MLAYRILARLDIKGENVVKGVSFDGLRIVGNPAALAKKYCNEGADEIIFLDTVATLYGRNQLETVLNATAKETNIPLTVGGGIKSVVDAKRLFEAGADKIAVNSAAIRNPCLIEEIAARYGRQAITVSVEAKRVNGGWKAYTDNGRDCSDRDAIAWAHEAVGRGAGEILLTSIDMDGTRRGADLELLAALDVDVPVVYSGGIRLQDALTVAQHSDGMAIGSSLHYGNCTLGEVKYVLREQEEIR